MDREGFEFLQGLIECYCLSHSTVSIVTFHEVIADNEIM